MLAILKRLFSRQTTLGSGISADPRQKVKVNSLAGGEILRRRWEISSQIRSLSAEVRGIEYRLVGEVDATTRNRIQLRLRHIEQDVKRLQWEYSQLHSLFVLV
jgi:hypothetical protein